MTSSPTPRRTVRQLELAPTIVRCEAAMCVALSVLLGNLRLLELPNGGSIAFATLPLLAFAALRGLRPGLLAGSAAGLAHALAGGTIIHPAQVALDYLAAYAVLAFVALVPAATSSRVRLSVGIVVAMVAHLACMVASGVIFFAPVAGDAALAYSLAYNATTVLPELALALVLLPGLVRAARRADPVSRRRPMATRRPPAPHRPAAPRRAAAARPSVAPARAVVPRPVPPIARPASLRRPAPFSLTSRPQFAATAARSPVTPTGAAAPDARSHHPGIEEGLECIQVCTSQPLPDPACVAPPRRGVPAPGC